MRGIVQYWVRLPGVVCVLQRAPAADTPVAT
jgi:hypothetical protein